MTAGWVCCVSACIAAVVSYHHQKKFCHKRAAAEHICMLKEKSDKLSIKNKFIATITHEIRNFVSKYPHIYINCGSIVVNSSFLKESGMWNEEVVNELSQAASFLSEILNNTLDISKLEEGKIEFNNSFESIRSVVEIVLSISKANVQKRHLRLDVSYARTLPDLMEFDKARLTQVVMNLVGNAIKFTPEKGRVAVRVGWEASEAKTPRSPLVVNRDTSRKRVRGREENSSPDSIERVPDEYSPVECSDWPKTERVRPRKIERKITSHLFVAKFHMRSLTGVSNPAAADDPARNSTFDNTPLLSTPVCISDSTRAEKRILGMSSRHTKKLSTFCVTPSAQTERSRPRAGCETTRHSDVNFALVKLWKVAKEFRMSQKHFPRDERQSVPKERLRTPARRRSPMKSLSLCASPGASRLPGTKEEEEEHMGTLTIEVEDTGCGMSAAEKERLFQPFSQVNKAVHSKFGGTGLGLWLCSKLVAAMKGSISCTSVPNHGTTFKVSLPLKARSQDSSPVLIIACAKLCRPHHSRASRCCATLSTRKRSRTPCVVPGARSSWLALSQTYSRHFV